MCREFHCLPSQLENEPADKLYEYFNILNTYDYELDQKKDRDNKARSKSGRRHF